ncbi:endonuclease VII domain-containing protein [Micromonospora andamanensis]|uniref:endonuclease VII domain-containing protein n=1 Tax=Micromonospora andamanensis TaxID=1287068 RepID=UPI003643AEC7
MQKACVQCGTAFTPDPPRRGRPRTTCSEDCAYQRELALQRERRRGVRQYGKPYSARENRLWSLYRITPEKYDEMLKAQDGVCAICGEGPGKKALHVDHDHACCPGKESCGKCVRGLLCYRCNAGIGLLRDSPEIMRAAVAYIKGG